MIILKRLNKKIPPLLIGILIGASVTGVSCKSAPEPRRYIICISDPLNDKMVCNQTGEQKDNFDVDFKDTENFRCLPEPEWVDLEQELYILRKKNE